MVGCAAAALPVMVGVGVRLVSEGVLNYIAELKDENSNS